MLHSGKFIISRDVRFIEILNFNHNHPVNMKRRMGKVIEFFDTQADSHFEKCTDDSTLDIPLESVLLSEAISEHQPPPQHVQQGQKENNKSEHKKITYVLKQWRSTRIRNLPDRYTYDVAMAFFMQGVLGDCDARNPLTVEEQINGKGKEQWKASLQDEMNSMAKNKVLKLVHLPPGFTNIKNK